MIDKDIIDSLRPDTRREVYSAFRLISLSGVIDSQLERLLAQLAAGSVDETDGTLAVRIKEYRRQYAQLHALRQLGELSRNEEYDDE